MSQIQAKQVLVVRTDLKMRKGKMIAQGAHAAMAFLTTRFIDIGDGKYEFGPHQEGDRLHWPAVMAWVDPDDGSFTKIVVRADSEEELLALEAQAKEAGVPHFLCVDAGLTEFHGVPTPTALSVGPANASAVDPITGHLKLL